MCNTHFFVLHITQNLASFLGSVPPWRNWGGTDLEPVLPLAELILGRLADILLEIALHPGLLAELIGSGRN